MTNKIVLIIFFSVLIVSNCKKGTNALDDSFCCKSEDNQLNLVFEYGVMLKNILNTFDCSYQKDLVLDPPITINLLLDGNEIDSIFRKMQEVNFFNYPDTFFVDSDTIAVFTPSSKYYFYVEADSIQKELFWNDAVHIENEQVDNLRSLIMFIRDLIESKQEYKELPETRGSYD